MKKCSSSCRKQSAFFVRFFTFKHFSGFAIPYEGISQDQSILSKVDLRINWEGAGIGGLPLPKKFNEGSLRNYWGEFALNQRAVRKSHHSCLGRIAQVRIYEDGERVVVTVSVSFGG